MQLSKYISELLYRYECVMVPNFGGFVSNVMPSHKNTENHQFKPPYKFISFNVNLQQNDGLLINHIAKSLDISFELATNKVQNTIVDWKNTLKTDALLLNNIGKIFKEHDQLVFEPLESINYLTSAFGLSAVTTKRILREKAITPTALAKKSYGKYIASAAIFAGLFFIGSAYYTYQQTNKEAVLAQQTINKQIQQASFDILQPLPLVTLTVMQKALDEKKNESVVKTENIGQYHIIGGAFKEPKNAIKKATLLKQKGFDAHILGLNKWGLTQVSYASFKNKKDAVNSLRKIRKNQNKQAWLFVSAL